MIRSSNPSSLVCPLATICGWKLPLRSRGTAISIAPSSPITVLLEYPLRLLPPPRPAGSPFSYPRCSLSSAPSARSSRRFLRSLNRPSIAILQTPCLAIPEQDPQECHTVMGSSNPGRQPHPLRLPHLSIPTPKILTIKPVDPARPD